MPGIYTPITKSLSFLEPDLLAELQEKGSFHDFKAGDIMIRKGQYFRSALIVIEGLVKIYRQDEQGNEFFMYYLEPGQACAMSIVCATRQETSEIMAVAVMPTKVLTLSYQTLEDWMTKYKSWNQFVLANYRQRFEEILVTLDQVAFRNMDERLEFYLKRQVQKMGKILPLTHQQIADDLSSSREVISRLLKTMEKNKRLVLQRNSIEWLK
jgi:CRP/FNR family transcriptional regulator